MKFRRYHDDADDGGAGLRTWYVRTTAISGVGNAMVHLITNFVLYRNTNSLSACALVTTFAFLPTVLLSGVATKLVGRFGGARLFVFGGIGLTAASIIPLAASATGRLGATPLLVWQLVVGIVIGMISPAGAVVTKMLAAPDQIPELNGRLTRARTGAYLGGVAAGGLVYLGAGTLPIFAFNFLSYVGPVVVVIVAMRRRPVPEAAGRLRDLHWVRDRDPALTAVFQGAFLCAMAGCFTVGLPAVADSIGASAIIYTVLKFVYPVGGLYVATSIRRLHGQVGWGTVQQRCMLAAAAGLAMLAVAPALFGRPAIALVLASMLVAGIGFAVYLGNAVFASLVQIAAPSETAGAVLTAYRMVPMLAIPFGQHVFGLLADRSSIPVALGVFSAVLVIGLAVGRVSGLRAALDAIEPIEPIEA